MKKSKSIFILLIFLNSVSQIFSQFSLEEDFSKSHYISSIQFDDSSYVVSLESEYDPTTITFYDKNWNQTFSKTLDKKVAWSFGDRPIYRNGRTLVSVPLVDKKNKISYNLTGQKGKLIVTVVNEKLESEIILSNENVYKRFKNLNLFQAPISQFDTEGNPFWIMTHGDDGIVWVKYNLDTKKIEQKFHEFEGASNITKNNNDYVVASSIGYVDGKILYAIVTDKGLKKDYCTITIYSLDENFIKKEESSLKLDKLSTERIDNIRLAYQLNKFANDNFLFTCKITDINQSMYTSKLYFIEFNYENNLIVKWENNTRSAVYNGSTFVSKVGKSQYRFLIGDKYGVSLYWDIDFDKNEITNIASQDLLKDKKVYTKYSMTSYHVYDERIFSSILFEDLFNQEMKTKVEEIIGKGLIPLVFKGIGDSFYIVTADYQDKTTTYDLYK